MTSGGSGDREDPGAPHDEPPELVEPPAPQSVRALFDDEPSPEESSGSESGDSDLDDSELFESESVGSEPPATEPSAHVAGAGAPDAGESDAGEPRPAPPRTQPTARAEADADPTRVVPEAPAFAIDSWLEAPPGTFPGLAEPPDDDLASAFADDRFREYEHDVLPTAEPEPAGVSPFGMPPDDAPGPVSPRVAATRAQVLVGACVTIIVLIALIASFAGGRAAARVDDPVASPSASPSASATPKPGVPLALAAPGVQPWDRLGGGECLQSFTGPWAESFTVVPCSQQHTAQLLLRAPFDDAAKAAYPGGTALQQRLAALCTATGVVDLARADALSDLQVSTAYPATRRQWESGQRDYFCFVSRQSGAPISGSLAGDAQQKVWAARAPKPEAKETSKPGP